MGYAAPAPPPANPADIEAPYAVAANAEGYTNYGVNPMTLTEQDAQSTFSIDVDTASYTISRRKLQEGGMPPVDSDTPVRVDLPDRGGDAAALHRERELRRSAQCIAAQLHRGRAGVSGFADEFYARPRLPRDAADHADG